MRELLKYPVNISQRWKAASVLSQPELMALAGVRLGAVVRQEAIQLRLTSNIKSFRTRERRGDHMVIKTLEVAAIMAMREAINAIELVCLASSEVPVGLPASE